MTVRDILPKLRARPMRGGIRLSWQEAQVLLEALGEPKIQSGPVVLGQRSTPGLPSGLEMRVLSYHERQELKRRVSDARLRRIGNFQRAEHVERSLERMAS